ncbi:Crp/Fnr family transcriptional regulator [Novosphingopyxis sp. YJ-S2-01]|uniref:Crp/Fnr family transcriptional regulator n=1 Tax=Novosphingopyxis sp. YJ-S2-01 TaxID=2794021 RepID=UPI0018DE530D|nr:Crp/Fnr family transcriptional regulator [Novosphingopyxis sp. YJ-S2-01]
MLTKLFLRGRLRHDLSHDERAALEATAGSTIRLGPRETLVRRGDRLEYSYFIVEGTMLRHLDDKKGERQLLGVNVQGDFVDLHGYAMKRLDHHVGTLTETVVAQFAHSDLTRLIADWPHLGRAMWFSTLLDAAQHREWIFRLGRLHAEGRIAHLICELIERLRLIGQYDGQSLPIPLLQRDYAEACGITPVHANRSFRNLRERGLLKPHGDGQIEILDEQGLRVIGEFDPSYLYGEGELALDGLKDDGA